MTTETKNTKVFCNTEIPCDWELKKFEKFAKFFSGGTPLTTKPEYYSGNIPFIKSGEIYLDTLLKTLSERDNNYLKFETEKLTKWAEDKMNTAELAIKETKAKIKELNREAQKTVDPTAQLKIQEQLQDESRKQKKQRQEIFIVEDEIAEMRDKMISDIQKRMKQEISKTHLFTINWKLV
jgi:delta 1-pyrroline-5-carboxylate dehydrogenase